MGSATAGDVLFTDVDLRITTDRKTGRMDSHIGGTVTIFPASDESDIDGYAVYFGPDATTPSQPVREFYRVAKTGSAVEYEIPQYTILNPTDSFIVVVSYRG